MKSVEQLKKDLSSDRFDRAYLLYGEEVYLVEHYKNQLIKAFEKDGFSDFNLRIYQPDNLTFEEFSEFFDGLPMMSNRKLMILNDFDLMKPPGEFKEKLPEMLTNVPDYLTIVFTFTGVEFKPDTRLNIWKILEKSAVAANFECAGTTDLVAWIKRRFKVLDKEISSECCEYLIFLCGNLMTNLVTEIDKIASSVHGIEITKRHIDNLSSPTLEAQIFELSEKVAQKDYHRAFVILNKLCLLKHEPIAICAVLNKQLGRMYFAKLALNEGKGESFVMKACGFRSQYPASLLCRSAARFDLKWLRNSVKMCYETDLHLKSNIPDDQRKLELLLCRLAGASK